MLFICLVVFALIVTGCTDNNVIDPGGSNNPVLNDDNDSGNDEENDENNEPAEAGAFIEDGKLVVSEQDQIDATKDAKDGKYANAKRVTVDEIQDYIEHEGIEREGNLFKNETESNQLLRIGFKDGEGILDFSAIRDITGEIGVDIVATIDVSQTTGGMYLYLKNDTEEEAGYLTQRQWIDWRDYTEETAVFVSVIELPTYFDEENAFIEILLPAQASITLEEIFFYMETAIPGFDDMHERITGGEGASDDHIHLIHNAAEFAEALEQVIEASGEPSIIYVDGTVSNDDWYEATWEDDREITIPSNVENLSVIGVADQALLDGIGFSIAGHNIIIENLTIQYVETDDGVEVNNGTDVWIRHNSFIDYGRNTPEGKRFDEMIAIKNNAKHVIISWNHLQESGRAILVGSNDEIEAMPDRKVIIHHNFFDNMHSRVPLFRGGHGHFYNNYIIDVDGSASNVRTHSKLRMEHNYYENVDEAIGHYYGGTPGLYELKDNIFDNSTGSQPTESTTSIDFKNYEYELDPVEDVPQIVTEGAGAGKIEQDLPF